MKKVFTALLVACLLTLGLAGAAMAGNISGGTPAGFVAGAAGTNVTETGTISGVATTVYTPLTYPAGVTPLTQNAIVTVGGATLEYSPSTNGLVPNGDQGTLSNLDIARVNNFYGQFLTYTGTGTFAATAAKNTALGTQFGGTFQELFMPPPTVFGTNGVSQYITTNYPFVGSLMSTYQVGQLSVVKFIPTTLQAQNGAAFRNYTLRTTTASITGTTDGEAWFTTSATDPSAILASTATFAPAGNYYLWVTLKDGGDFDLDATVDGMVVDPPAVGIGTTTSSGGGGSSDGCVFNPMAGLSVEWALLILPALAALVARIRRK